MLLFFRNLEVFGKEIQGNFIVLCGFSKYGTYGLGRMLSSYIIKNSNVEKEEEEIFKKDGKETTVNDLLSIVNEEIAKREDDYCIEVVIEFEYAEFKDEFGQKFVERARKKLMAFNTYDRENHTRKSLMDRLKADPIKAQNMPPQRGPTDAPQDGYDQVDAVVAGIVW